MAEDTLILFSIDPFMVCNEAGGGGGGGAKDDGATFPPAGGGGGSGCMFYGGGVCYGTGFEIDLLILVCSCCWSVKCVCFNVWIVKKGVGSKGRKARPWPWSRKFEVQEVCQAKRFGSPKKTPS